MGIVIQHDHTDSKGQLIMPNAKIKDKNYFLINLYGPNKDAEAVCFYQDLSIVLFKVLNWTVIARWKLQLSLRLSIFFFFFQHFSSNKGGILIPQHVINLVENIQPP